MIYTDYTSCTHIHIFTIDNMPSLSCLSGVNKHQQRQHTIAVYTGTHHLRVRCLLLSLDSARNRSGMPLHHESTTRVSPAEHLAADLIEGGDLAGLQPVRSYDVKGN